MLMLPARSGRWVPILAAFAVVILFFHLGSGFGSDNPHVVVESAAPATVHNETAIKVDPPPAETTQIDPPPAETIQIDASPAETIQSDATPADTTQSDTSKVDTPKDEALTPPSCRHLPGLEDVLVVLKTGITESQHKVPVHVRTTLRCVPHKLIVSDFEEDIGGIRTLDVFRNVSETLLLNQDFALYNRAQVGGRQALTNEDQTKVANGPSGMMDNPGWKLDKWKFLPMIQEARAYRPNAKWYVFLEADTYPIWPNLLGWLENFDSTDKLYLGNQMQIADHTFAHGGSGFVISNAAMHAVADYHAKDTEHWEKVTNEEWAGDCILGMALAEAGVGLTWSWPHCITQSVWEQDALGEAFGKEQWCYPPFTFHHMTPSDVEILHEFDQRWFANENNTLLTYGDVFTNFIRPMLSGLENDWTNNAPEGDNNPFYRGPSTPATAYDCAEFCARSSDCLQYRLDAEGRCLTSGWALRGLPAPGVVSGTMLWRVDDAIKAKGPCRSPKWVT